jgi:hypothetical protein
MFGYILGPLILCFGYKVRELVVVFNSLITCGVGSYIETLQYISQLNAQISNGKVLPQQAIDLCQIMLGAFTLSLAAVKVPSFKAGRSPVSPFKPGLLKSSQPTYQR